MKHSHYSIPLVETDKNVISYFLQQPHHYLHIKNLFDDFRINSFLNLNNVLCFNIH